MKNGGVIASLLLLLAIWTGGVASGSGSLSYIEEASTDHFPRVFLDRDLYILGENVKIDVAGPPDQILLILHENHTYAYANITQTTVFNPGYPGEYIASLAGANDSIIEARFWVALPNESAVLLADRANYSLGEAVNIRILAIVPLNHTKLRIISENTQFSRDDPDPLAVFFPVQPGLYRAQIENISSGRLLGRQAWFSVPEPRQRISLSADRRQYVPGDTALIHVDPGDFSPRLVILSDDHTYTFLDAIGSAGTLRFRPDHVGNYTLRLVENQTVLAADSFVLASESREEPVRPAAMPVPLSNATDGAKYAVDFSADAEARKSIIDHVFGTSPLTSVTAYIQNHSNDSRFSLHMESLEDELFLITVSADSSLPTGAYTLVAEARIRGDSVRKEMLFVWVAAEPPSAEPPSEHTSEHTFHGNETNETVAAAELSREIPLPSIPHFAENISIEVDFAGSVQAERTILETVFKRTVLEELTAFIENASGARLSIAHIESDRFRIGAGGAALDPGTYKLVAVGRSGGREYREERWFSVGRTAMPEVPHIATDKREYSLGDIVHIESNVILSQLNITCEDDLVLTSDSLARTSYVPHIVGTYWISAKAEGLIEVLTASFSVAEANTSIGLSSAQPGSHLRVHREQADGIGVNHSMGVSIILWNTGSTVHNATLYEVIPPGWSAEDLPMDAELTGNTLIVRVGTMSPDELHVVDYAAGSPPLKALDYFLGRVEYWVNSTKYEINLSRYRVEVNASRAFFDVDVDLYRWDRGLNRTIANGSFYEAEFVVRNAGSKGVADYETIYTWRYPNFITIQDVGPGCEGTRTRQTPDEYSILECRWKPFSENEEKRFTLALSSSEGDAEIVTFSNVTYDPPLLRIPMARLRDDPDFETQVRAYSNVTLSGASLIVYLLHDSADFERIWVESHLDHHVNRTVSAAGETVKVTLFDYAGEYFTVSVGDELLAFGNSPILIGKRPDGLEATGFAVMEGDTGTGVLSSALIQVKAYLKYMVFRVARFFFDLASSPAITGRVVQDESEPNVTLPGDPVQAVQNLTINLAPELNETNDSAGEAVREQINDSTVARTAGGSAAKKKNRAPVANLLDLDEIVNGTVVLDASGSSDPDGDALNFVFMIDSDPGFSKPFEVCSGYEGLCEWDTPKTAGACPEAQYCYVKVQAGDGDLTSDASEIRTIIDNSPPEIISLIPDSYSLLLDQILTIRCTAADNHQLQGYVISVVRRGVAEEICRNEDGECLTKITDSAPFDIACVAADAAGHKSERIARNVSLLPVDKVWHTTSKEHFMRVRDIEPPAGQMPDLDVKDSKNKSVDHRIKNVRKVNGSYDLEIEVDGKHVQKVRIRDLRTNATGSLNLRIDDVPDAGRSGMRIREARVEKAYSIDPSALEFGSAEITSVARALELWKCRDWDFEAQACLGTWEKVKDLRPGKEYTISITADDPGFAEIGLVTINTHKSIYLPNETARIALGILDHGGNVVCDADVTLAITDPAGIRTVLTTMDGDINVSDECSYLGVTGMPDYYTSYSVGGVGSYSMNVTAVTYDGEPNMVDNFSVQASVDYDVERIGHTRIYPYVPYTMNFTIIANKNYNGDITESVPLNFTITPQGGLVVSAAGDRKILAWNLQLKKGNTYSISYEYDAPDVSPELYRLGPLVIGGWQEARSWQIASDAGDGMIHDDGTFQIDDPDVEIDGITWATASINTDNTGGKEAESWDLFVEDGAASRVTASCAPGVRDVKVTMANGSGGVYSTYCADNTPDAATIRCVNVPDDADLGTISFRIVGCEAGTQTYNLEASSGTNGGRDLTGTDTLTVNALDTIPPKITLRSPSNNASSASRQLNFTFNVTTNDDIRNCSLWTNESGWAMMRVNASAVKNGTVQGINRTLSADGLFRWNIECYDVLKNSNFSVSNRTVRIDTAPPTVSSLDYPGNGGTVSSRPVDFNFTATDGFKIVNCSLWGNFTGAWGRNKTAYNPAHNTETNITISPNDGIYKWNAECYDSVGNRNSYSSNYTVRVDTTAPNVSLETPANDSIWDTSLTVDFRFNVSDLSNLANCSLVISSRLNKTNDTAIYAGVSSQKISQELTVGNYDWSINCTDMNGFTGYSETYNVTVVQDIGAPSITVGNPTNASYTNDDPVAINLTTNEQAICKLSTNSTFNFTTGGTLFNNTNASKHSSNIASLPEGSYTYYFKCNDTYGNTNNNTNKKSVTFTIDRTYPSLILNAPAEGANYSESYVLFNWTVTDSYTDGNLTCNLSVNGRLNISGVPSLNTTATNRSVYVKNGTHNWSVMCADDAGNVNVSTARNFTIDGDAPQILASSISASPGSAAVGTSITIAANVSDSYSDVSRVYVNVTRATSRTSFWYEMSPASGSQYQYVFTDTSVIDIYEYYIRANDTASPNSNINTSDTYEFNIAGIKAVIGILAQNSSYKQGRTVNVSAPETFNSASLGSGKVTTYSLTSDYTQRTCSDTWGFSCGGTGDDTFDACPKGGSEANYQVTEVFLNATEAKYSESIRVSCQLDCTDTTDYTSIYYRNTTSGTWRRVSQNTQCAVATPYNETVTVKIDDVEGTHQVRCIISRVNFGDDCAENGGTGSSAPKFDNDDANFTVLMVDVDDATDPVNYSGVGGSNYTKITDIDIDVQLDYYNNTASSSVPNRNADLEILLFDGSSYSYNYTCGANDIAGFPHNCSHKVVNSTILNAWTDSNNRKLQMRGIDFDFEGGIGDQINWSSVHVGLSTPTKTENYGLLDISARLVMKLEYRNGSVWRHVSTIYNQSYSLAVNETVDLHTFWNNNSWSTNNRSLGTYRAVAALTSTAGNVLETEDGRYVNDSYEFNVSYLKVEIQNPQNGAVVDATSFWINLTVNTSYSASGGWCAYSYDSGPNQTMQNDSSTHFRTLAGPVLVGEHKITFYCNDTDNDISHDTTSFNATDQTKPSIRLMSPPNEAAGYTGTVNLTFNVSDIVSNVTNCSVYVGGVRKGTNSSVRENTPTQFTVGGLDSEWQSWYVECYDNSTNLNRNVSVSWSFLVGGDFNAPWVYLDSPADPTTTSDNDILFVYKVIDQDGSPIANCSLIINGKVNHTNQSVTPYVWQNFTINDLQVGQYNWTVNCTDIYLNTGENIEGDVEWNLTIIVDSDDPHIDLQYPEDEATLTTTSVGIQYNVSDNSSGIDACTLMIKGTINGTHDVVTEGAIMVFNVNFSEGFYNWSVNCTDDSYQRNSNRSETRNLTITTLSAIKVNVSTDDVSYEQGTQYNDTVVIYTNVTDAYGNSINSSVDTDVVYANTSLRWWNASWLRRKAIFMNESRGLEKTNVTAWVNLTNLGGSIGTCSEIRVIRNASYYLYETPYMNLRGDDATYCEIAFNTNVSANAVNENNFYAYYNYSGASAPIYYMPFNQSDNRTGIAGVFTGTGYDPGGAFSDTFTNNNAYWFFGSNGNTKHPNAYAQITFNITYLNISEDRVKKLVFNITYCHSGADAAAATVCDGAEPIEGTKQGDQNVEVFNYYTHTWVDIGNLDTNNNEFEVNGSYQVTSNMAQYINDTTHEVRVRYELHYQNGVGLDSWLVIDYAVLNTYYDGTHFSTSAGSMQLLANRSSGFSGDAGQYKYNISTSGLGTGWYSAVSFITSAGYNNGTNFTLFEIITDETLPTVSLSSPADDNRSDTGNVTFRYTVTDTHSGIENCTLILNNQLNESNQTAVVEGGVNSITLTRLPNGQYSWTVNCTDDSSNKNTGTFAARNLSVEFDTAAPNTTLVYPPTEWNDTDASIIFQFTFADDYAETADCILVINNKLNETLNDQAEGATGSFPAKSFNNGTYTWYVNCTDDSLLRNTNKSTARTFNVREDEVGPALNLEYPGAGVQLTTENVTFRYNVTDAISNITACSLVINGTVNWTNTTIAENVSQNFTVHYLDGHYNWSINCTDASENHNTVYSESRKLIVASDNEGPGIQLRYPPPDAQLFAGNIQFNFTVTDFASGIENCSLVINDTFNKTIEAPIGEGIVLNITSDLVDGDYEWYVNCTDDSPNFNENMSAVRYLTVGVDETPPQVTLESPEPGHNDTNAHVYFTFQVEDLASAIENCSLIIDNKINISNQTIDEGKSQFFSLFNIIDGAHTWRVNCTDEWGNTGNSTARTFTVTNDIVGPVVDLSTPANNTVDTDGDVTFYFNASDAITTLINCSLIVNGKVNKTNASAMTEGASYPFSQTFSDGQYNWSVNCTDDSENLNKGGSLVYNLTVRIDNVKPSVKLISPDNGTYESDGARTFSFNVTDAAANISSCSLIFNQSYIRQTNTTIQENITQYFTLTGIGSGVYNWSVNCTDGSDNANVNKSSSRVINVIRDSTAPSILLGGPDNYTQDVDNNIIFFYNVTDQFALANCTLIFNGSINLSNASAIVMNSTLNFTYNNLPNGTYRWNVNCTDTSESYFAGSSEIRTLFVGPDVVPPVVRLGSPSNGASDTDGNVIFRYNVTDFASSIANCSLIFNGKANQTNQTVNESQSQFFVLNQLANGNYSWSVNCTDNSTAQNTGNSTTRNLTVGADVTAPVITLVGPDNNTITADTVVTFRYRVYDSSSDVSNCSLIIDGKVNETNKSIANDNNVVHNFTFTLPVGNFLWNINCTDNAPYPNTRQSDIHNLSIILLKKLLVNVTANGTAFEQGLTVGISVNATDNDSFPVNASIVFDLVRGNTTASWWNASWSYRIPAAANATNVSRYDELIEYDVNFTSVIKDELGLSSGTFDPNSVRVIEWAGNQTVEIVSQFDQGTGYNASANALGTVYWIMNGSTPPNGVRLYHIYFDTIDNPKPAPSYPGYNYTYSGVGRNVTFNGTNLTADWLRISYKRNSMVLQFSAGRAIKSKNMGYQGAGSLWNITVNATQLSNRYSGVVPFAVAENHYLNTSEFSTVTIGPVVAKIRIPGNVTNNGKADADLNYTVWFTDERAYARGSVYVHFGTAQSIDLKLKNVWFAYIIDNATNWDSYMDQGRSKSLNLTHRYNNYVPRWTQGNTYYSSPWYSEAGFNGSINAYLEYFRINDAEKNKGITIFDGGTQDYPEGDLIGFYGNISDPDIIAEDDYNVRAWMVFSPVNDTKTAENLTNSRYSPVSVTGRPGQEHIRRNETASGADGYLHFIWSSYNETAGWYSAVAYATKPLYRRGLGYTKYQVAPDATDPIVNISTPEGWLNFTNITFGYHVTDNNPTIRNCTLITNGSINATAANPAIGQWGTITFGNFTSGVYNWSVNCTDAEGNVGGSIEKTIKVDLAYPGIQLHTPNNTGRYTDRRSSLISLQPITWIQI
ncbi:MAG: Ig-like domain-containing protein [archaeon]